jgi:modification methylase
MAKKELARKGTKTSTFGTSGRVNHDASEFYDSKLYGDYKIPESVNFTENLIPAGKMDKIYCKSSETMDDIPNNSVHLMITSPPYNVKKEYDNDLSLTEYRALLKTVFLETFQKLVPGGRACINIANLGRKPYIPLHSYIIEDMLKIGFLMRGEIIWNKAASASPSTAWGSWQSAKNPVLRDIHEYILVFCKDVLGRNKTDKENTIQRDEFLEWTKSVWTFPPVSAKSIGHPAPFPEELPNRLIQLYSFKEDIVLDPFCGSGSTCLAALKAQRHYIGYDIEPKYVELAEQRLSHYSKAIE